MEKQREFRYACYIGKYKEALDAVSVTDTFYIHSRYHDLLTTACVFVRGDDVEIIQMIIDRGFDTRNVELSVRWILDLLQDRKTRIVERMLSITVAHTNYLQLFSATFATVAGHYEQMFRLLIYMFDCGAHPDWIRCMYWDRFLPLSGIYNTRENIRKVSIALIATKKAPRDILRIISRVLWSTRADERWYKLK